MNLFEKQKLIKNWDRICQEKTALIIFPYAGGGASAFNGWVKKLEDFITICPIQLPGREERITEIPYMDMKHLLADLVESLQGKMTGSVIFFGHSMGAKIVYELEKMLEKEGKGAAQIILSGCRVPHKKEPNPIYHLPDEQFKSELGRFDGTPKEILENKELLEFFLPMLRADFTMDETYYTEDISILDCPITVFGGRSDKEANPEEIAAWGAYTRVQFRYRIFDGGHFFIREKEEEVLHEVRKVIKNYQAGVLYPLK